MKAGSTTTGAVRDGAGGASPAPALEGRAAVYTSAQVFAPDGLLAASIDGYDFRPQQQAMAAAVDAAISQGQTLVAEAGTGTGKTYAYLVPAILSGRKVIVSTGSRNLQDQLFFKDVPFIRTTLGLPARIVLLKGRANYLCRYRLQHNLIHKRLRQPRDLHTLEVIRHWAGKTRYGDIAELPDVAEDSPVWPHVTSTADNCLGGDCPDYNECYLMRARRAAQAADIVIVNHHLFLADRALKDEGFGDLLPGTDIVIFDEAHQLPETALNFFGVAVSSRQIRLLARDSVDALEREGLAVADAQAVEQRLESLLTRMRGDLGPGEKRLAWSELPSADAFPSQLAALADLVRELGAVLRVAVEQNKAVERCLARSEDLARRLAEFGLDPPAERIPWLDLHAGNFSLHSTPLSVAPDFQRMAGEGRKSWIFTSATLSAAGSFAHFVDALGLQEPLTQRWESPFDFQRQALLYLPAAMPLPQDAAFTRALVDAALPVLRASRGRAFMLFTSYRAMHEAHAILREQAEFNLLVQGQAGKMELLQRFRQRDGSVLLATASFWEGVDVRGQDLSCVIIDKLPFASPSDPVTRGRLQEMTRRGENPFWQLQVPQAIIMLKQGVGRLIRDRSDCGVLMIGDPRLLGKTYGRKFLGSLPPLPLSRDLADVQRFFHEHDATLTTPDDSRKP